MSKIQEDLVELKTKLKAYVNEGRRIGYGDIKRQPLIITKPDITKIKPLTKVKCCDSRKRAHNWGIYLMRVAYASVEGRKVNWGYDESLVGTVGDRRYRSNFLMDRRLHLESELALKLLHEEPTGAVEPHGETLRGLGEGDYILSLYEEALRKKVNLLAVSKQSPMLCDEKGRDFMASTSIISPHSLWVYHPVKEANMAEHLYGDVSLVKLCEDSPHVFRCDIMGSLTSRDVSEFLSPRRPKMFRLSSYPLARS